MKTSVIILAILAVLVLLFIGHLTISFKPFSISLPYWNRALGIVLFIIGLELYCYSERIAGYKEGLKSGMDKTLELLNNKLKEIDLKDEK